MTVKMEMGNGVQLKIKGDEIKITLLDGKIITVNANGQLETSEKFQSMPDSYRVLKESVEELRL